MSREIKFRAWDSANAKMIQVKQLTQSYERYLNNGELKYFDYPLMQFTGLKDKNGKEIYDGDILLVELQPYSCPKLETFKVIWNNAKVRFELVDKNNDWWSFDNTNRLEVIGNIYENPELLENK